MPVEYTIDENRGVLFVRAWGDLTDEAMLTQQRRARTDPAFDPAHDQLLDLSQVEQFAITSEGVAEMVAASRGDPAARRAFIAPADVAFGMARMTEILLDGEAQEVAVFRAADEARRWLGLRDDDSGPDPGGAR